MHKLVTNVNIKVDTIQEVKNKKTNDITKDVIKRFQKMLIEDLIEELVLKNQETDCSYEINVKSDFMDENGNIKMTCQSRKTS